MDGPPLQDACHVQAGGETTGLNGQTSVNKTPRVRFLRRDLNLPSREIINLDVDSSVRAAIDRYQEPLVGSHRIGIRRAYRKPCGKRIVQPIRVGGAALFEAALNRVDEIARRRKVGIGHIGGCVEYHLTGTNGWSLPRDGPFEFTVTVGRRGMCDVVGTSESQLDIVRRHVKRSYGVSRSVLRRNLEAEPGGTWTRCSNGNLNRFTRRVGVRCHQLQRTCRIVERVSSVARRTRPLTGRTGREGRSASPIQGGSQEQQRKEYGRSAHQNVLDTPHDRGSGTTKLWVRPFSVTV